MGRTTIKPTKQNEFWIHESFVELLSHYIAKAFEAHNISTMAIGAQEVYDDCKGNLTGAWSGFSSIDFYEYITTEQEKIEVLHVLNETKALVGSLGEEISVNDLNKIEDLKSADLRKYWSKPVRCESLIATIEIIEQMIRGEWKGPDNYGVWFKGFPHPDGVETI